MNLKAGFYEKVSKTDGSLVQLTKLKRGLILTES